VLTRAFSMSLIQALAESLRKYNATDHFSGEADDVNTRSCLSKLLFDSYFLTDYDALGLTKYSHMRPVGPGKSCTKSSVPSISAFPNTFEYVLSCSLSQFKQIRLSYDLVIDSQEMLAADSDWRGDSSAWMLG